MTPQEWAAILTAVGVGAIGKELVAWAIKAITGRTSRQRHEIDRTAAERDEARARELEERRRADRESKRADDEARKRRVLQEHASALRSMLFERGRIPPEYPVIDETQPRHQIKE
ncbi:hypothetical protein GCM10027416_05940 [Okibacterium endophyticum]